MIVSLISAVARNFVIGKNNHLPWRLPDDMKHFMKLTKHHPVIMGRRTYDSLLPRFRPLPDRTNIVITHQAHLYDDSCLIADSLDMSLRRAKQCHVPEAFIIGGAQVYRGALSLADCMYLTEIKAEVDGDVYFPEFDRSEWTEIHRRHHSADFRHAFAFDFVKYARKK